jgi:hypothetical protein
MRARRASAVRPVTHPEPPKVKSAVKLHSLRRKALPTPHMLGLKAARASAISCQRVCASSLILVFRIRSVPRKVSPIHGRFLGSAPRSEDGIDSPISFPCLASWSLKTW